MKSRIAFVSAVFCACATAPAAPVSDGGTPPPSVCDAFLRSSKVATVAVDGLEEASGLVASRVHPGVLFSHNDSGNDPELFAFDAQGRWLGTWTIDGAKNKDWEDLGIGPCAPGDSAECLYLADIGDNGADRSKLAIDVVRSPDLPAMPERGALPLERRLEVRYPDGARDAETILIDPATTTPFVVAKRPVPEPDRRGVYAIRGPPGADGIVVAERVGSLVPPAGSDGLFTGGSVHPNGRRVLLRTYGTVSEYVVPEGLDFQHFLDAMPVLLEPGGAAETQGEAITYDATGRSIYTTSEGKSPPLDVRECAP